MYTGIEIFGQQEAAQVTGACQETSAGVCRGFYRHGHVGAPAFSCGPPGVGRRNAGQRRPAVLAILLVRGLRAEVCLNPLCHRHDVSATAS